MSAWNPAEFVAVASVLPLICNLIALTCQTTERGERQSLEIMNLSRACSPKIVGNITWRALFYLSSFLSGSVNEQSHGVALKRYYEGDGSNLRGCHENFYE